MRTGNFLERLRDKVVQRSLIGKRKLDRTATRRSLDGVLRELGERYHELVRAGRMEVPPELATLVNEARRLEERMAAQEKEIASLEGERPSTI